MDYANHLARMHIHRFYDDPEHRRFLQAYYEIHWELLPNLAMDLVVPTLARLVPVPVAGRIFIGLMFLLTASGAIALHFALYRRIAVAPFLIFLFLYNGGLAWGLLGYLFGLALFLWFFAGYACLAGNRTAVRLSYLTATSLVLFVVHLYALGVYGVAVLGFEVSQALERRNDKRRSLVRLVTTAAPFLLPATLLVLGSPTAAADFGVSWSSVATKLFALTYAWTPYDTAIHVLTYSVLALGAGVLVGSGRLALSRRTLPTIVALSALFIVMPACLLTSCLADTRITIALLYLTVASLDIRLDGRRSRRLFMAILLAVLVGQMWATFGFWRRAQDQIMAYVEAFRALEPAARLVHIKSGDLPRYPFGVHHLSTLAIMERDALDPQLFASPRQQPVRLRPEFRERPGLPQELIRAIARAHTGCLPAEVAEDLKARMKDFDYLLVSIHGTEPPALCGNGLRTIREGPGFGLYRVE
jgi:hypothetical protein